MTAPWMHGAAARDLVAGRAESFTPNAADALAVA